MRRDQSIRFGTRDDRRKAWIDDPEVDCMANVQLRDIEVMVVGDVAVATLRLDGSQGFSTAEVEAHSG